MKNWGRHVFGAAAIAFGVIALLRHDFDTWQRLDSLWQSPFGAAIGTIVALAEICGGFAIQWRRTEREGGLVLALVYLFFALRWVPRMFVHPLVYGEYGNFFEQFSLVCGALVVSLPTAQRVLRILLGICTVSFTLEQLLYLDSTASFVPSWLPPSPMFWAVVTTIAFALAAVSLITGIQALLAARLTTLMIVIFGLAIWLPTLILDPHKSMNWAGNAQNALICGAMWILADRLAETVRS